MFFEISSMTKLQSAQPPVFTFLPARQVNILVSGKRRQIWFSLQYHHLLHSYISQRLATELKLSTYPDPRKEGQTLTDVPLEGGLSLQQVIVADFEPLRQLVPSKLLLELRNTGTNSLAYEENWKSRMLKKRLVSLAEVDLQLPTFLNIDEEKDIEPTVEPMHLLLGLQHYTDHFLFDTANQTFRRPTADLLYAYTRLNDNCGVRVDDDLKTNSQNSKGPLPCRWILSGCLRKVADLRPLMEFDDEADFELVSNKKEEISPRSLPPVPAEPFPVYEATVRASIALVSNPRSWLIIRILYSPHSVRSYLTMDTLNRLVGGEDLLNKAYKGGEDLNESKSSVFLRIRRFREKSGEDKEEEEDHLIHLTLPVLDTPTVQTVTRVPEAVVREVLASYDVELSDSRGDDGDNVVDMLIGQDFASRVLLPASPVEIPITLDSNLLQSGLLLQTKLGWTLSGFGGVVDDSVPVKKDGEDEKKDEKE